MDNNDPLPRAIDSWVHTSIGLALMAARTVPGLVNEVVSRGCAQVGEAEANLRKAQMIGQVAVGFGTAWLRSQIDPPTRSKPAPAPAAPSSNVSAPKPPPGPPGAGSKPRPRPRGAGQSRQTAGAGSTASRGRPGPTPAGKSTPPGRDATPKAAPKAPVLAIPAYDGLSAQQVVARLGGLTGAELRAVRRHEAAGRGRKTVLAAVDRLLA